MIQTNRKVGLMRNGRVLAEDSPENLIQIYSETVNEILISKYIFVSFK